MSGWAVYRRQPSTAVFGGIAVSPLVSPGQASGWLVVRRQPSTAVWGGLAAFSNVVPVVAAPGGIVADYDGKTWWKKKWILRL